MQEMTRPDWGVSSDRSTQPSSKGSAGVTGWTDQIEDQLNRAQSEISAAIAGYQHIGNRLFETQRTIRNMQIAANSNHVIKPIAENLAQAGASPAGAAQATSGKLVSVEDVLSELGISKSMLIRLRKANGFPVGIRISHNRTVFYRSEIDAWLHGRRIERAPLRGRSVPISRAAD